MLDYGDLGNKLNWDAGNEYADALEAAACAQETADIAFDKAKDALALAENALTDAPEDGRQYGRKNGEWSAISVSFEIDGNDKVLTGSENGLRVNLSMVHDPATGVVSLIGRDDEVLSSINLPLHQIVTGAEMVTNPEGQPEGTYIALHLVTESGPATLYINVSGLVDAYTPGNAGISIADYKVSVVVDANSGLTVGPDGLTFADGISPMSDAERDKLASIEAGAQVNTVTSVAGKTGDVTLDKSDVGLGSVDNTADMDKPVSTAQAAAIAEAVGEATPAWENITGKPDAFNPAIHAVTHHTDGLDALAPADIGAVNKAGDTMTGALKAPLLASAGVVNVGGGIELNYAGTEQHGGVIDFHFGPAGKDKDYTSRIAEFAEGGLQIYAAQYIGLNTAGVFIGSDPVLTTGIIKAWMYMVNGQNGVTVLPYGSSGHRTFIAYLSPNFGGKTSLYVAFPLTSLATPVITVGNLGGGQNVWISNRTTAGCTINTDSTTTGVVMLHVTGVIA